MSDERPTTVEGWIQLLNASGFHGFDGPPETREERLCRALERLLNGMLRERAAWSALLAPNYGMGRMVREVKKALNGSVQWPEPPEA